MKQGINYNGQQSLFVLDRKDGYRQIRNFLAGRFIGATRDEALLKEVIKCVFCKLHLKKKNKELENIVNPQKLGQMYNKAFQELKRNLPGIFEKNEKLLLDQSSLNFINQKLDLAEIETLTHDPFGDAFEAFIGSTVRAQLGQFFTPENAVNALVSIVDPRPGEKIIDPACGSGAFLNAAARYMILKGGKPKSIANSIWGIDKDQYLIKLASARLSMVTLAPAKVFCADSLAWELENGKEFQFKNKKGKYDVVLTNPPFGARIVAVSQEIQRLFELGYIWKFENSSEKFIKLRELQTSVPPQVLFIERCLHLVRVGGRIGMVVPESLISGRNYRYVIDYIRKHAHIRAVLGMPESLFKTSGKGGTHTKTCLLYLEKKLPESSDTKDIIFMAEAKWCGRDSRGRQIKYDELPEIVKKFQEYKNKNLNKTSHLGYKVEIKQLSENILAPRYYNPEVETELLSLRNSHHLIKIKDLVDTGALEITTGDEVGKLSYGTGPVPFVRSSDISNWEIKVDPKHTVSEEIYNTLKHKQDVQEGDILMVRDGTYLIGTCAYITKYDTRIVFQSHLYKIRVKDRSKLSPYLLLVALSSAPVKLQIKSKQFTQDIIDSLGNRIYEIVLPIPKDMSVENRVTKMAEQVIKERIEARELARKACLELIQKEIKIEV